MTCYLAYEYYSNGKDYEDEYEDNGLLGVYSSYELAKKSIDDAVKFLIHDEKDRAVSGIIPTMVSVDAAYLRRFPNPVALDHEDILSDEKIKRVASFIRGEEQWLYAIVAIKMDANTLEDGFDD